MRAGCRRLELRDAAAELSRDHRYIIETFIAAAEYLDRPELIGRAQKMIDWELSLQPPMAHFRTFWRGSSHPVIFNRPDHAWPGNGLTSLNRQDLPGRRGTGRPLAGGQQDEDGCYRKHEHNGVPHVYNTRASGAGGCRRGGERSRFLVAARRTSTGTRPADPSGWFATNAFLPSGTLHHTIAYAIRGFIEVQLLGEARYLQAPNAPPAA